MLKNGFIKKDYALIEMLKPYNLNACEIDLIIILLSFNGSICNYKQSTLANKLSISERTLRRYIHHLKSINLISTVRKRSHTLFISNIKVVSSQNGSNLSIKPTKQKQQDNIIDSKVWFSNHWEQLKEDNKHYTEEQAKRLKAEIDKQYQ